MNLPRFIWRRIFSSEVRRLLNGRLQCAEGDLFGLKSQTKDYRFALAITVSDTERLFHYFYPILKREVNLQETSDRNLRTVSMAATAIISKVTL
ncbi:hypothetical protein CDAR_240331 [Caerostris darwini]|uniref:LAGLIDADG homing endonuclease n=1 Tax=Caerostris darwini TaxID=1538125 RepID=A0AAV4SYP3_9ARAC|nr:hypothetical protein CDAR_240331 [Caerostris darwini]